MFSEHVCKKLGHYVYRLIDPRNGETFYVGKGTGNRVFQHLRAAAEFVSHEQEIMPLKIERIRAIQNAGLEVQHIIHRHGIAADAIFDVEAAIPWTAIPVFRTYRAGTGPQISDPCTLYK